LDWAGGYTGPFFLPANLYQKVSNLYQIFKITLYPVFNDQSGKATQSMEEQHIWKNSIYEGTAYMKEQHI
jgi:hypothetical protein